MKSFKQFVEEITTADVPVTQQGPYRNSGMLNPYIARRAPLLFTKPSKQSKKQMKFEEVEDVQETCTYKT